MQLLVMTPALTPPSRPAEGEGEENGTSSAAVWPQNRRLGFMRRLGIRNETGTAKGMMEVTQAVVTLSLSAGVRAGIQLTICRFSALPAPLRYLC